MKNLYFLKSIDTLGRVVIPKEVRKKLNIDHGDHLEIEIKEDKIILKKHDPTCIFCNASDYIVNYKGKNICHDCMLRIKLLFGED